MIKFRYKGGGIPQLRKDVDKYEPPFVRSLFKTILRIRVIEDEVAAHYHEDKMKTPVHLAIGQEAVPAGCCAALTPSDHVYCGHRTHGVYLAKGGDLNAMMSEFHCKANGCCGSRGGSMHLLDKSVGMMGSSAIVAGIIPIATGAALAAQMKRDSKVTAVFIGDAAVEEGAAWESMNFAALKKLPILYCCENNFYSVCSPLEVRQPEGVSIYRKAEAFGLYAEAVDGNNVIQVYEATQRAVEWIRSGRGPAFIEAYTYRWKGHHGGEDDTKLGYRSFDEVAEWKQYDPVAMLETVLLEKGWMTKAEVEQLRAAILSETNAAFQHALNSPEPSSDELLTHVYSEK